MEIVAPTAEELAEEQAAAQVPKEDEIRSKIIEDYGFDEDSDKDRIDKLTQTEMEHRTKLHKAIGQKITHRTEATRLAGLVPKEEKPVVIAPVAPVEKKDDLTQMDLYALMQAQVPQEDVPEVVKAAKMLGVDVTAALKDSMVQTILARNAELRKSAAAGNRGPARPGSKKITDAEIIEKANKGEIPEPGTPEAEQLFHARRAKK